MQGEEVTDLVEINRHLIVGFTAGRLFAMKDIRTVLGVGLVEAKSIVDNLPYVLCETSDDDRFMWWRYRLFGSSLEMVEEMQGEGNARTKGN